jgi:ribonuclease D
MNPATTLTIQSKTVRSISRDEMAALPIRRYEGEVCLVTTPQDLERALADLRQEPVVGFDTETRPSFKKGETHLPCLVQAATARRVYLFQLQDVRVFRVLAELLAETRVVKVGVALANDLRSLKLLFPFVEQNVLDLGVVARRCRLDQTGLRNLAGMVLGVRVPKGARTSNWAAARLSDAQITYAATDAWICRELFLQFQRLGLLQAQPSTAAECRVGAGALARVSLPDGNGLD